MPPAATANVAPKGDATPGADLKTEAARRKSGASPTPVNPSPETIRRQMQGLERANSNVDPRLAPPGGGMMMRKTPPKPSVTATP